MVWIKDTEGSYVNLDNVDIIYVRLDSDIVAHCCHSDVTADKVPIYQGNRNCEDSQKVLDQIMESVKQVRLS